MTGELSKILDSVEQIGRLDLDDVAPTTHVVEVANALRAGRAAPVAAPRGRAVAGARRRRRRLPRPQPAGLECRRLTDLTAAEAVAAVRRGDLDAGELFAAYRDRAAADELNAFLWVADGPPTGRARPTGRWPASRSASRTSSAPRTCPARRARGSWRATGRPTPRRSWSGWRTPAPRCWARPTRTSSRWGPRTRTPPSARSATRGTAGASRAARAAAAPPPSPRAARRGRSARTRAARSASRPRCAASSGSSPPTARSAATG